MPQNVTIKYFNRFFFVEIYEWNEPSSEVWAKRKEEKNGKAIQNAIRSSFVCKTRRA